MKSEEDFRQILLTLISIFPQNMDEFEKQVQTLESVHPLISKYRQAGLKKLVFSTCLSVFRNQRENTYSCLKHYFCIVLIETV